MTCGTLVEWIITLSSMAIAVCFCTSLCPYLREVPVRCKVEAEAEAKAGARYFRLPAVGGLRWPPSIFVSGLDGGVVLFLEHAPSIFFYWKFIIKMSYVGLYKMAIEGLIDPRNLQSRWCSVEHEMPHLTRPSLYLSKFPACKEKNGSSLSAFLIWFSSERDRGTPLRCLCRI